MSYLFFVYQIFLSDALTALAPPHIPEAPIYSTSISALIHVIAPAFRVLLLLPLLASLMSPRITYSPIQSYEDIEQPIPTDSSFLLPPDSGSQPSAGLSTASCHGEENSKYGTFRTARSDLHPSSPVTRAATPVPSTSADLKVRSNDIVAVIPLIPGFL